MYILLTLVLSFYPTIFIYTSIPASWMKLVDGLVPPSNMFFFIHLALFAVIFFIVHIVLRKFISLGYGGGRRGVVGIVLMTVFTVALSLISFYNILPGNLIYATPNLIENYVLKNPYTFIALVAPFIYLFFD